MPDRNDTSDNAIDRTWLAYDRQIVEDELDALWASFQSGVRIVLLWDSSIIGTVLRSIDSVDQLSTRTTAEAQQPRIRAMPRDVMIATYRAHADSYDAIQQALPTPDESRIAATVLMITACQDNQLSLDGSSHGVFTGTLLAVWDGGAWGGGGYGQFYEAIRARCPTHSNRATCA